MRSCHLKYTDTHMPIGIWLYGICVSKYGGCDNSALIIIIASNPQSPVLPGTWMTPQSKAVYSAVYKRYYSHPDLCGQTEQPGTYPPYFKSPGLFDNKTHHSNCEQDSTEVHHLQKGLLINTVKNLSNNFYRLGTKRAQGLGKDPLKKVLKISIYSYRLYFGHYRVNLDINFEMS